MSARSVGRITARLAAGALLAIALSALILGTLHTPPARRYILTEARSALERRGILIEASSLDYNLLALRFTLSDLRIRPVAAPDFPDLLRADLASINLRLRDLVRGRYRVESAIIEAPEIQIVINEQGRTNLPPAPSGGGETSADWFIDSLRISNASLTFEDRRRQIEVRLPSWQATIEGDAEGIRETLAWTTLLPGEIRHAAGAVPIDVLTAALVLTKPADGDDRIDVREVRIASGASGLAINGSIRNLGEPVLDLAASGNLWLDGLTPAFAIQEKIAGELRIQAAVRGRTSSPEITAGIEGDRITLPYLGESAIQARGLYDPAANRLRVSTYTLRSPLISSTGDADLSLDSAVGESRVDVRLDSVDLRRLTRLLDLPVPVTGQASGRFRASWQGLAYPALSGNGQIRLRGVDATGGPVRIVNLGGLLNLAVNDGDIKVTAGPLIADGVQFDGDFGLSERNAVSGSIRIEAADAGAVLKDAPVSGALSAAIQIAGTLAQPRIEARLESPGLSYGGIRGIQIDAAARYAPDAVDIGPAFVRWQGQTLETRGRIGLVGQSPVLDLAVELPGAALAPMLAGVPEWNIPTTGQISASMVVTGTAESPLASLQLRTNDLEAYGVPLGAMSADARFEGGILLLDNLVLNPRTGTLRADGRLDVASGNYDVNLDGRGLELWPFLSPEDVPVQGTIGLSGRAHGTFVDPQASLRIEAAGLRVQDHDLGALSADVALSNRSARIEATLPSFRSKLNASIGIDRPFATEFELRTDGVELSRLPSQPSADLSGVITATLTGNGTLDDPRAMRLRALVEPLDLEMMGRRVTSDGPIAADLADSNLILREFTLRTADSTARLAGWFPLTDTAQAGDLRIDLDARLADLLQFNSSLPQQVAGRLAVHANLRGHPSAIDAQGDITIDNASMTAGPLPAPLTDINVRATLAEGNLDLDRLTGKWGSAVIEARGNLPLPLLVPSVPILMSGPARPAHLSAEMRDFRLSSLPGVPEGVDGRLALRMEAAAASGDLKSLTATVSFPELRLSVGNYEIQQAGMSSFELHDGLVTVGQLELTGPETRLRVTGSAGIQDPMSADLLLEGNADASILNLFARNFPVSGNTNVRLTAQGSLTEPRLDGFLDMSSGQIALVEPRVNVEGLRVKLDLSDNRVTLARLEGTLNGGVLTGEGGAVLTARGIDSVQVKLESQGFYLEFPQGVRTVSNANVTVAGNTEALTFSGNVDILEGSYNEPLSIERSVFEYLSGGPAPIATEADPVLARLRLNVGLRTLAPLVVDSEFARGSVTADVRLSGTAANPGLNGRIVVEEGAELTLRERTYLVDRGVISLVGDRGIQALLDVTARTKASGHDITMQIQRDEGGRIATTLTSDPPLPEPDILSILATGRTLSEAQNAGIEVAREQVLSYLAGGVGGGLTQQAGRAIGLSQLQIEPSLIASEAEPTARLTVGKKITPQLNFVYSMNLRNSSDQIWIGEYDIARRFSTRATRQGDSTYRFQFQHNLFFGGFMEDSRGNRDALSRKRIGTIQFEGDTKFSDPELRKVSGLETGKPYDFFATRRALDRVRDYYSSAGFLEARIFLSRTETGPGVDLRFELQDGPRVEMVYEGWDVSEKTKQEIRKSWESVPIDSLRTRDAVGLIESEMAGSGYLRAGVETEVRSDTAETKRVLFRIQPGVYHDSFGVAFDGANSIRASDLEELLRRAGYMDRLHSSGANAATFIQQHYLTSGFLDARVLEPQYELDPASLLGRFVFPVKEGPLYRFGEIRFSGNRAFSEDALRKLSLMIGPEQTAVREAANRSRAAVEGLYLDEGFNDASVQYRFSPNSETHVADVTFEIKENRRRVLDRIQIAGNDKTSQSLIRSQIGLNSGDVVSGRRLVQARSNLYGTGAFSLVDINVEPLGNQTESAGGDAAVTLSVLVRETPPFQLQYGGFYDTERGLGGIADFFSRNVLGGARTAGLRTRYDSDLREVRAYFSQPPMRLLPLKSVAAAFFRREAQTDFLTDRKGVSGNMEYRLGEKNIVGAGYRFEWVHTYEKVPDPVFPFDIRLRVAPLTGSFTRDTRDDTLDAARGRFTSHTFEWTPAVLGSELRYLKYFGQFFQYVPFGQASTVPWAGGTRNRTVYAVGGRVGLAHGFGGQTLVPSERFFSGGGTTVRGFDQNTLGPLDFAGQAAGGSAVLILNNELRFPVYGFLDGVGFFDAGNVYRRIEDFALPGLRTSAGAGLRIRTPYALIRLDYGVNVRPRPGEPRGKFFFSIGQAF